ncbi:hypothetical protein ACFY8S_01465 [Streptomyces hygroscopicus]|uniref:hypothetical protein n=1 Tax=Streptomyces hygroscopicus TaxID=1912 RepID=UPI0036BDEAF1
MAGGCGRTYRVDPSLDPAPCNALQDTGTGLLVPATVLQGQPGITVTAPAAGDCPQAWQIGVDASWAQNSTLTFAHALNGADRVYEQITEIPPLTIPRAGTWEVDYNTRGVAQIPAGTAASLYVVAGIYKNGALIVGSEAMLAGTTGAGSVIQIQATGGMSFLHPFAAGDVVTLWAYRVGQTGTASIASNPDGRTRISCHWLAPVGDGP